MENLKTAFLTFIPSSPAFYLAIESPSGTTRVAAFVLPVIFFIVGKTVDVWVKVYLMKKYGVRER